MPDHFTSVPILDLALARSPTTKPKFLEELRKSLIEIGFFYVGNHLIPAELQQDLLDEAIAFFGSPEEEKAKVEVSNSKHFSGYAAVDTERTGGLADHRETYVIMPKHPAPSERDPIYYNTYGPNQWPDATIFPRFQKVLESYMSAVDGLAREFNDLVAEALDIEPTILKEVLDNPPIGKLKLNKYPSPLDVSNGKVTNSQGIGAHKDGNFLTYLLQATKHAGLEVQSKSGIWIPVPPLPGTLVVNIGSSLEALTQGVCTATTHRVNLRPQEFVDENGCPLGPRFSFGFFQFLKLDLTPEDAFLPIPDDIASLVKDRIVKSDAEELFTKLFKGCSGNAMFLNALTTYPEAGKRWYPNELAIVLKEQENDILRNGA